MSYQKQNFANGEVLTAPQLNHIEDGIADVESTANTTKGVVDKIIDPTLSVSGKAADAAKTREAVNAETVRAKAAEEENAKGVSQLKENIEEQTELTQGNILPTNIYHGRYAYVVPDQMKLYLAESDNMTVSEYKLDANKKYTIKSSVENSVSYLAGCTATKMDTPSGKFGTPLDYTESFEASEKQKVIEFTYTPTEECY